jgi:hypothetical protein
MLGIGSILQKHIPNIFNKNGHLTRPHITLSTTCV